MGGSTHKFEGLAGKYDAHRATYPGELLAAFGAACCLPEGGGIIVDVGSGTGISTRLLRALFPQETAVIGVEPGHDMRRTAVARSSHLTNLAYLNFPAEALPFAASTVDGIFVAQALHWFDRPAFYAEAARVLRRGGTLALIDNNRAWRESPFLADYEVLLERYGNGYGRDYRRFDIEAELGAVSDLVYGERLSAGHTMTLPKDAFIAWSFTSTIMQDCIRNIGEERMRDALQELLARYFTDETAVEILYTAELTLAKRG